jgi:4-hydroxy-2-oxoheptanedioate aldolase
MKTPANAFRQAIASGRPQVGLWLALADGYAAEVAATAGFDWLCIDAEHAPNSLASILAQLQAIAAYPAPAVIRLPDGNSTFIKQVLELGATSLLVPMVESVERARELVRAVRYPPRGMRGAGSGLGRSSRWGLYRDYLQRADDSLCLGVQLETVAAIDAAAAIASVDGIDCLLVGPGDLSASMGLLGQAGHADVVAQVDRAIAAVRGAGKPIGVYVGDEALARRYLAAGASFVALGSDIGLLARASRELAAGVGASIGGAPVEGDSPAAPAGPGSGY